MRSFLIQLFLVSLVSLTAAAQSGGREKSKKPLKQLPNSYIEPVYRIVDPSQTISDKTFHKIMNQNYSSIASGQGQGVSLANFGSFDPVAGICKLNYFTIINFKDKSKKKNGNPGKSWYLNLSAGGNIIGNNIGVLFNNSKFNSGMNVTGKLHIPVGKNSIMIGGRDADALFKKKQDLEYQRWAEKMKVWNTVNVDYIQNNIADIQGKIDQAKIKLNQKRQDSTNVKEAMEKLLGSIKAIRDSATEQSNKSLIAWNAQLTDSLMRISGEIDAMVKDNLLLTLQLDSLNTVNRIVSWDTKHTAGELAPFPNYAHYGSLLYQEIDKHYDALIDSLEMAVPFQPYTLKWIAVVGMYNRNTYYTYNDSLPFSQQVSSNQLSVFDVGLEFNLLHSGSSLTHYLNVGVVRLRNNNIGDLNTNFLSRQIKTIENDTTQIITQNYNVYTSAITEYEAWKLYANYYLFFDKSSRQAIHLIQETEFRDTHQTPVNLGLGYVFSFKNGKDNALVNVEAYVKFFDVFKALPEQAAYFYNRNSIGLQFGIPVNIPTSKIAVK